jgi:hypothetical protein
MGTYVCIVFGDPTEVIHMETFEAAEDGQACGRAIAMQRTTPNSSAFELWRGGRKISAFYGHPRPRRSPADR